MGSDAALSKRLRELACILRARQIVPGPQKAKPYPQNKETVRWLAMCRNQ